MTAHLTTSPAPSPVSPHRRSSATRRRLLGVTAIGASWALLSGCMIEDDPPEPAPSPTEEPSTPSERPTPEPDLLSQQGVSAAHPDAVGAGEEVLAEGGNAVDAAIATALAVSVVEPYASGLGGGGSVLIAGPDGDPLFYDYREVVAQDGEIPESGTGIPGFVAGLGQLHEEYGSAEWQDLVAPAEDLAREGFEVTDFLHTRMTEDLGPDAVEDLEQFSPGGDPLDVGETLVQEDLATTLGTLGEQGWESFYTGELAEEVTQVDGVDADSLGDYEVDMSEPVSGAFGDYEIVTAAPALPGVGLVQMLQIAEDAGIAGMEADSAEYIQTLSDAWLVAEETVFSQVGDPRFVDVPVDELTDPQANAGLEPQAVTSDASAVASSDSSEELLGEAGTSQRPEAPNTSHISVVDSDGIVVSMTNTLTNFWGSGEMTGGYFLNNQLSRFEAVESPANLPEPGRRSVTWSNPTLVMDQEGRPVLAIGTPGGHQILNALGTVLTRWGLQDASLDEAVAALRYRYDAEAETLFVEEGLDSGVAETLEGEGWTLEEWPREYGAFGSVQALEIDYDSGELSGVEDPRREGTFSIID